MEKRIDTETEEGRMALLAEAQRRGIDLVAIGTARPDGAVTLDWDALAEAVEALRRGDSEERPA